MVKFEIRISVEASRGGRSETNLCRESGYQKIRTQSTRVSGDQENNRGGGKKMLNLMSGCPDIHHLIT